jgi:nitrite reductase/ring-hydroxylating ferredoxin subunit
MPDPRSAREAAPNPETAGGLDRRTLLRGVAVTGALGASAGLLAGCGGGGESGSSGTSGSGSAAAGNDLGSTSQIPVGGGKVFAAQKIVVTQPTKGQFEAFSAICTHQGCPVDEVSNGKIICPCHGSMFSIKDGSVVGGPAPSPLPKKSLTVKGGEIKLA